MDWLFVISNITGGLSVLLYLLSDLQSDDKKLDLYYTYGNIAFVLHLVSQSEYWLACPIIVAIIRNYLFRNSSSPQLRITFLLIYIGILFTTLMSSPSIHNVIPACVSIIMTIAFAYTSRHALTALIAFCSFLWIYIGIEISSFYIIASEIIGLCFLSYRSYKQTITSNN